MAKITFSVLKEFAKELQELASKYDITVKAEIVLSEKEHTDYMIDSDNTFTVYSKASEVIPTFNNTLAVAPNATIIGFAAPRVDVRVTKPRIDTMR